MVGKAFFEKGNIKLEGKWGMFIVNGKYYQLSSTDGAPVFKQVSTKEVKSREKMARELATKLKDGVDAEKILVESFMVNFSEKDLKGVYKAVFKGKRKLKTQTREHRCVDLKVGNFIVPIIG